MRLHVSVHDHRGPDDGTVLSVETDASVPVGALAVELARATGAAGTPVAGAGPRLYAGQALLDPTTSLGAAGVRDGSVLALGGPRPSGPAPEGHAEVRIVSGPGAGTVFWVPAGEYGIGAGEGFRIALPGTPETSDPAARLRIALDGSAELLEAPGGELDGEAVTGPVPWRQGALLASGDTLLELSTQPTARAPLTVAEDGLGLEFNRPPRFPTRTEARTFRLLGAPTPPEKRPIPLLPVLLLPAGSALVSILATGNWVFVLLALLSPLGALLSQFGSRRQNLRRYQRELAEHEQRAASLAEDVRTALLAEQHALRAAHPDPAAVMHMADQPSDRLWERRWSDPDFLTVRVGTADLPSTVTLEDPDAEEHRRTSSPWLHQVPIQVDLRAAGVVGVAGPGADTTAAWITAQAVALHSPADLRLVVLAGSDGGPSWSWTRWLPHARPEHEDAYALLGTTTESLARRLGELVQLVAARTAAGPQRPRGGDADEPDVLVVLAHARRARSLPGVVSLLRDGPAVGVYLVCTDSEERLLPEESGAVVVTETPSVGTASLRAGGGEALTGIRADLPEPRWFEELARDLAPLRGVGDGDEAALPGSVRLLDLLGLEPPTAEAVAAGWALGGRSTTAVLGAGYDQTFAVDLVRDGPHGLIAGTTGSGKSELLQSLVASLAVVNRPDEMTFVLIDYKGGSAFAECAELPHTVGLVTDLDAHLVERALTSLGAELRRRETLLAAAGAKDIGDYLDKRARGGEASAPLPRLLIVIDEFASMIRELPDFVAGLVNIAQRGRSLGIHLVLATQRPGGAVTPDIRANTNLRIALRTTDPTESRDIIDAPDSGSISPQTPGRAFARLGPSLLLPFQSARVGGRRPASSDPAQDAAATVRATAVSWEGLGGPVPVPPARRRRGAGSTAVVTDLAVLADQVAAAAEQAGLARQPSPWLPPLPTELVWERPDDPEPAGRRAAGLPAVTFGMVDRPALQRRDPLTFDLARDGHLQLIGSPRSGRSQALRTLAAGLAAAHGADDLHLYGIDCGNGALKVLAELPHTGAVVDRVQTERLGRLLDRLNTELSARQSLLGERGTASLDELRRGQRPGERTPHVVVMVDRFEVFDREFASFDNGSYLERMIRLLRDGPGVGIHLVLAGDRVLGGSRYSATTDNKLVLRMNDRQDYSMVGVPSRSAPVDPGPGRAIQVRDRTEVQLAVLDADLSGTAQADRLSALATELGVREASVPERSRALRLDLLPDRLGYDEAARLHDFSRPMAPLLAVGGDTLDSLGPDLSELPSFVIAGPPRTGRSTALLTAAESLLSAGTGLVVLAPRRSPLRELAGRPGVAAVLEDPEVSLTDFRAVLTSIPEPTAVVLVDDAELLVGAEIDPDLGLLARGAQGSGWGLLVAGNAESLSLSLGGWVGQVRRNRTGLLLSPQSLSDGEVIGQRLSRGLVGQAPQPGRGLLHLGDGRLLTVQVPHHSVGDRLNRARAR